MTNELTQTLPMPTHGVLFDGGRTGSGLIIKHSVREIGSAVCKDRGHILTALAVMTVLTLVLTFVVVPKYLANATLLVLLSTEYSAHREVGSEASASVMLEKDAFLKAESEILKSPSLEKKALEQLGIYNLYPRYVEGPGLFRQLMNFVEDTLHFGQSAFGMPVTARRTIDPVDLACAELDANLTATADKAGNIIKLNFRHKDPALAAELLNTLINLYLEKRSELYSDAQAQIIADQATSLRAKLDEGMDKLANFKARKAIANYETQRDIILHQHGDLTRELQQADSAIAQANRRLDSIQSELARTPKEIVLLTDTNLDQRISNLKTQIEDLRVKESGLEQTYRENSRPLMEVRAQISAATTELNRLLADNNPSLVRRGRNVVYDNLTQDAARIKLDLQAAVARREIAIEQMAQVKEQLSRLEDNRVDLDKLEQNVSMLEAAYRASVKNLEERRSFEGIASKKAANVRIIQSAEEPIRPQNIRMAVLVGGLLFSAFVGILVAVLSEVFRRGYISPEKLERSLGVPVLASVPEVSFGG